MSNNRGWIDDDDLLRGYDLEAWQPPAAPDVADAVVARMREPVGVAARSVIATKPVSTRRRWWWAAGITAGAAAAGAVVTWLALRGGAGAPPAGEGSVATSKPSLLELGSSTAQLESNTEVRWRREGHRLIVEQLHGSATWNVGPDDTLALTAPQGDASVAVAASGASLRVEVGMNASDVRVIGTSAATAAITSLVMVVVYGGHAEVTSGGQSFRASAGETVAASGDRTPSPVTRVDDHTAVAGGPAKDDDVDDNRALLEDFGALNGVSTCGGDRRLQVSLTLDVAADGTITPARLDVEPPNDAVADCVRKTLAAHPLRKTRRGGRISTAVTLEARCNPDDLARKADAAMGDHRTDEAVALYRRSLACRGETPCDDAPLVDEGKERYARSDYDGARVKFEAALACNPTQQTRQKAFAAACGARDELRARALFADIDPAEQTRVAQLCLRNGIDILAAAGSTSAKTAPRTPTSLSDREIRDAVAAVQASLLACDTGIAQNIHVGVSVLPSGLVDTVTTVPPKALDPTCVVDAMKKVKLRATDKGGKTMIALDTHSAKCAEQTRSGKDAYAKGNYGEAQRYFEKALACGENSVVMLFATACNLRDEARARQLFKTMDSATQVKVQQICIRNGIDPSR